ncbi:MAG: sigma factor-like helix-turn-helix DNA-binding protein [Acidimicrobiales bacterium]
MFRVVTNLALSAHSSGGRSVLSLRRWATSEQARIATHVRPDEEFVDREMLRSSLAELPRRHREAITLHYVADLPVDETAKVMGVSTHGPVPERLRLLM